jgi:pimeloyl-ACP methyl ester carboxylesterase
MVAVPSSILVTALLGLLAVCVLMGGALLLWIGLRRPRFFVRNNDGSRQVVETSGFNPRRFAIVIVALALIAFPLLGRHLIHLMRPAQGDLPQPEFGSYRRIQGASGAELAVQESGPAEAPRLVFTHGWGADRREWQWAREALSQDYRVISWDLPGLGQSAAIPDGVYTLEKMARDLQSVLAATGTEPAVLVGHSIGGMINLTASKLGAGNPGPAVAGIIQLNTTYTNPVRTMKNASLNQSLQKPVFEPLLHAVNAASPIVRVLNGLAYSSGLAHWQLASSSFAGTESREQLDFMAHYVYRSSPSVLARGTLAMLHWDASDALPKIAVPVLIISGDQDTTTLPEASTHMQNQIPEAHRLSVSPAAHLGPVEQHERYNEAIRSFAREVVGAAYQGEHTRSRAGKSAP